MSEIYYQFQEFCDYELTFNGLSPATIRSKSSALRRFFRETKIESSKELTTDLIEQWIIKGKIKRNWSPKTRKLYLDYLSGFCRWLVQKDFLKDNPVAPIPRPRLPKRIPHCLSEEECETILAWVKNYPYQYKFERKRAIAIIATFMATGMRRSELRNLKMEDVDLVRNDLCVRGGKGAKDRVIPFRYSLAHILREYLNERSRLKKTCPYFFTAMRLDSRMDTNIVKRLYEKISKKCGIHFYPHLLRHTFATRMLESGLHIAEVSKLMGHASIETTTVYLTVKAKRIKEQINRHGFDV